MDNQLSSGSKMQIISLLPGWERELESLFIIGDESFMELANDYLLCKNELSRFQNSGMEAHASEYLELVKELEAELILYVNNWKKSAKLAELNNF